MWLASDTPFVEHKGNACDDVHRSHLDKRLPDDAEDDKGTIALGVAGCCVHAGDLRDTGDGF